eukprot:746992-Hanusia_phi.AAC.1
MTWSSHVLQGDILAKLKVYLLLSGRIRGIWLTIAVFLHCLVISESGPGRAHPLDLVLTRRDGSRLIRATPGATARAVPGSDSSERFLVYVREPEVSSLAIRRVGARRC